MTTTMMMMMMMMTMMTTTTTMMTMTTRRTPPPRSRMKKRWDTGKSMFCFPTGRIVRMSSGCWSLLKYLPVSLISSLNLQIFTHPPTPSIHPSNHSSTPSIHPLIHSSTHFTNPFAHLSFRSLTHTNITTLSAILQ